MSPKDIPNDGNAPTIVFSEACYGAYINNKNEDEAISLKFLSAGTRVVVGSTCVAYGSVSTPLIGADLLASYFWKAVKNGIPVGEAVRNAKVMIAQEMTKMQGFLDGEDQKTLISFVLYGDPLLVLASGKKMDKKVNRDRVKNPVVTVCQNQLEESKAVKVDARVMAQVKQIVEQYLPGLKRCTLYCLKTVCHPDDSILLESSSIQTIRDGTDCGYRKQTISSHKLSAQTLCSAYL